MALSYYCFGPNLGSWFGLIDDHETIKYLGPDRVLYVSEMPGFLLDTEVGHPFEARRFRPIYYSLRLIETALWRDNVALWYGVRMAAFAGFAALMAYYFIGWFGWRLGGALSLLTLGAPYWADIFGRLGPPENYTVPAMGLVAFGLSGLVKAAPKQASAWRWLAILLGSLVAVGVKENYLFLLPLLVWAVYVLWKARRWRWFGAGLLILLLCSVTVAVFLLANFIGGSDFYGDDTSLKGRLKLLLLYFRYYRPAFNYVVGAAALLLANVGLGGYIWWRGKRLSSELGWLCASVACLGLSAVQYLFYKGLWPHGTSRYDFPGLIFLGIAVACWLRVMLGRLPWHSVRVGGPLALLLISVPFVGIWSQQVRQLSLDNLSRTSALRQRLDRVVAFARENPSLPIVVVANDPLDAEAVDAIIKLFDFNAVNNPKSLAVGFKPTYNSGDAVIDSLSQRLEKRSLSGDNDYISINKIDLTKGCAVLPLSGSAWQNCKVL